MKSLINIFVVLLVLSTTRAVATPTVGITGTLSVCVGANSTLSTPSSGGAWSSSNMGVASIGSASGILTGVNAGTSTISYTVGTEAETVVITVNAMPATIGGSGLVCEGASAALTNTSGGGLWSSGSLSVATVAATSGAVTGVAPGTATITYTLAGECYRVKVVTVNPSPGPISGTNSACVGAGSTLSVVASGGIWSASSSIVSVSASTGAVTGATAGTASISYTLPTGCRNSVVYTVFPLPAPIGGPLTLCTGNTGTLTNLTTGGTWLSISTSIATINATTGVISAIAAGTSTVSYTSSNGCVRSATVTVNAALGAISGESVVCAGQTAILTNATSGGTWSSNNLSVATINASTGMATGVGAGTATITYSVSAGCYITTTITVNAALAGITGTTSICQNSSTTLAIAETGGSWSSSNTLKATVDAGTGLVTGVNTGTANISYIISAGCYKVATITILSLPSAITGSTTMCAGASVTLSNATSGGSWTSGSANATVDASTGVVTGVTGGTSVITYTLSTGCLVKREVTVNANPDPIAGTLTACAGSTTALTSHPSGGYFMSTSTGIATIDYATGILTGINGGTATIKYILPTGCLTSSVATVSVTPGSITGVLTMCVGSTTSLSSPTFSGVWSSTDGAVATVNATTGVVTGASAGTSEISYTVGGSCGISTIVTVSAATTAITGDATVCVGQTKILSNATAGGTWSSSASATAGVSASSGILTGYSAGTAIITYTASVGCYTTLEVTVVAAVADITGANTMCAGATITLTNPTPGGTWSSSNTLKATVDAGTGVVTGVSSGTANITYMVSAGCYKTFGITVHAIPASISGPTLVCDGATITLSSVPSGGTWVSSDVTKATVGLNTGVVTGVATGTTMITYTKNTCSNTLQVTVGVGPNTGLTVVCAGQTIALSNVTTGGTWSSSSTGTATVGIGTGIVTGVSAGVVNISYTIAGGCSSVTTVTVNAALASIGGLASLCLGETSTLTQGIAGGTWISSDPTKATIDISTGFVTSVATGNTTITYTLSPGCVITRVVTVNAVALATTGTMTVCAGATTTLSNATPGGVSWSSSDLAVATVGSSSGIVTGVAAGTAVITYNVSTGCNATSVVTVHATPTAIAGVLVVCQNNTSNLSSTPAGGTWTSSTPAVASIDLNTGVLTAVAAGNTTVTYTLSTGCSTSSNVTVNPSLATTGTMTVCAGATTTLSNATPGGVSWSSSDLAVATVGSSSGIVTGVAAGTAVITYNLGTGCNPTSIVTVHTTPTAIAGVLVVCQNNTSNLSSTPAGGTWTSSTPAVASIDLNTGVLTAVAAGNTTVTYTLSTGCSTSSNVTINPSPFATTGTLSVCNGLTTTLSNTTPGGLSWQSGTPGVATVGSATGVVTGVSAGTTIITYLVSTGCNAVAVVTVNALPTAITGSLFSCPGGTTTLASTPTGGTWSSSDVTKATIGAATGVVTGVATGTTVITYTTTTGCIRTSVVSVNAVSSITGTATVCQGTTTTLAHVDAGGTWSSSATGVATVNASGLVTGVSSGNANITYVVTPGCFATRQVTVSTTLATANTGTASMCAGSTTTLANATTGGAWAASGGGVVATVGVGTGVVTGVSAGTSVISYIINPNCRALTTATVNAIPAPITIVVGTINAVCVGTTKGYQSTTPGGTWASADVTKATVDGTGVVTGVAIGTVNITYTVAGCFVTRIITVNAAVTANTGNPIVCIGQTNSTLANATGGGTWGSSNTGLATVNASTGVITGVGTGNPFITYTMGSGGCFAISQATVQAAVPSITGTFAVCPGATQTLANATAGGTWSSSNLTNATVVAGTGVVSGVGAGTANITYTLNVGCFKFQEITVNGLPAINNGAPGNALCVGSVSPAFTSSPGGGTWASSNAAVGTLSGTTGSPTMGGVSAGTVLISYTTSICTATKTISVGIPAITGALTVCVGNTVTLSNAFAGGLWSSNTPARATVVAGTGVVTGVSVGTSNITYTRNGCTNFSQVTVNAALAGIGGSASLCIGSTSTLTHGVAGGTWSSSDLTKATVDLNTGVVTGVASGNSTITYVASVGCFKTIVVTVNTAPGAITGTLTVCEGAQTALSNATGGGTWSSSTPANATVVVGTGVVTGVAAGTATITYHLGSGCQVTAVVTVDATPAAITGTLGVCVGNTTTLSSATAGGAWTSSAPGIASVVSGTGVVSGVANGNATITYTGAGVCFRTAAVTVNPLPTAIGGTFSICAGSNTTLTNGVGGGNWTSSDVTKATVVAGTGVMTGVAAGTSTISYGLGTGCVVTQEVTINALPAAISGTLGVCVGSTTTLSSATAGGAWTSSAPGIASVVSGTGVVSGVANGNATITYTGASACFRTAEVTVNPVPTAIGGTFSICAGAGTTLTNGVGGGNWTSSDVTKATIVAGTGVMTGVAAGTSTITYALGTGCVVTQVVTINALPAAISGTLATCPSGTTTLSTTPTGGTWVSTSLAIATIDVNTGVVTGVTDGNANITYTTAAGCEVATIVTVTSLATTTGTAILCTGTTTTLTNTTPGGTWSSSNTARATVGAGTGVVTGISGGTVNISYRTTSSCFVITVVTVNTALATANTGTASVCTGLTTTLANATGGGTWSSSNPARASVVAGTGVVTGITNGTVVISYIVPGGCSATTIVTVNGLPNYIHGTFSVCEGATTTLTGSPSGGTWSSGTPANATVVAGTGVVSGIALGTSAITYTLGTGCILTQDVSVNAAPGAIGGTTTVCIGGTSLLTCSPAGGVWTSSASSKASVDAGTGLVTGVNSGTARITYTLSGGCRTIQAVTVSASPSAITGTPYTLCAGSTITLGSATFVGDWTSSDGAVATIGIASGIVTGMSVGTSLISYTNAAGCAATRVITVNAAISPITGDGVVCQGQTNATLANATPGGTWSTSASAIASVYASTGLFTGVSVGNANITYKSGPGCFSVLVATVNAAVDPITGPSTVIVGNTVTQLNATGGGTWSSSNTYKATIVPGTGVVTGVAAGTATITYSVSAGCYRVRAFSVTSSREVSPIAATEGGAMLTVYPNPTSGTLTIEASVNGTFAIYTIDGREVAHYTVSTSATSVVLPNTMANGIYMCRFSGDDMSTTTVRLVYEK